MQPLTRQEALGTYPVFLLEVIWEGNSYKFSTFPVEIYTAAGGSLYFGGGLSDPELQEKMESMQADPESGSVALEAVFPVNLVQKYMQEGKTLDNATAQISMVMEMNGYIVQNYEDRIKLFSGLVLQPIIGDPEQPVGYCAFSIERNPLNQPRTVIPSTHRIQIGYTFASSPQPIGESSTGKAYPLCFGAPNQYPINEQVFVTPAYLYHRERSSTFTTNPKADIIRLLIAGHEVEASAVDVIDFAGNTDTFNVRTTTDLKGQVFSYIQIQPFSYDSSTATFTQLSPIVTPFMEGVETSSPKYFISWADGGGFSNPYGTGTMTGAGDIIRYMLSISGVLVDLESWNNIAGFLNSYEFAGYINDPEITAYEWLMTNILPYIPVEVVNGFNGLRGVVPLYYKSTYIQPRISVELGTGVYLLSAFEPVGEVDDIINRIEIKFAYNSVSEDYSTRYNLSSSLLPEDYTYIDTNIEAALLSFTRYGDRFSMEQCRHIYNFRTAAQVAMYLVRKNAFLKYQLQLQADIQYGYLDIGDVISINSTDYYMEDLRVQIVSKRWSDNAWIFGVLLEDNVSMRQNRR